MCTTKRKSPSPPASTQTQTGQDSNGSNGSMSVLHDSAKESVMERKEESKFDWRRFRDMGIVWRNVIIMLYIHIVGLYGLMVWFSGCLRWTTIMLGFTFGYITSFGVTAGAHRLWAHKCYKAKLPLRILLAFMQTCGCQNSLYEWCRDHRVHHKFTETDADPHNVKRGFFFAHVGWLLVKKHDDVKHKGKKVDMTDLEQDPVVMFQKKYFIPLTIICCFWLPYQIPVWLGEEKLKAWNMVITRYMLTLNFTWLVNSAAHMWGPKPYDSNIHAVENKFVSGMAVGEGWHNYHHIFPWDYKAAELTTYNHNWATAFIDFFAWIGWAYDLKTVPERVVLQRVRRTGDGSHPKHHSDVASTNNNAEHDHGIAPNSWGWDDEDVTQEERRITVILNDQSSKKE